MTVVGLASHTVVTTISTGPSVQGLDGTGVVESIGLSPDGKTLWVNNRAGGTTESLDAATLTPIHTYKIPGGPDDMAFAPDGRIWITRRWAEKVAILDPVTGLYETIEVGRSPHGLFLNPKAPSPAVVSSR